MKLLRPGLLAAALAAVSTAALTTPAQAAEPYVTKGEFRQVSKHMKLTRVHAIFDTAGRQTLYFDAIDTQLCNQGETWACASQSREYKTRSEWGFVDVDFYRQRGVWKVERKYAYWG